MADRSAQVSIEFEDLAHEATAGDYGAAGGRPWESLQAGVCSGYGDIFGILGGAAPTIDAAMANQIFETLAASEIYVGGLPTTPVGGLRLVSGNDVCPDCQGELRVQRLNYVCINCLALFEPGDFSEILPDSRDNEPGEGAHRGRLRLVGAEARWRQADLDRSNSTETSEVQKKATYEELCQWNTEFASAGGNPFSLQTLKRVAEDYYQIQCTGVKRSHTKRRIIASLVLIACINQGYARSKTDAARFARLPNSGIAAGDDYMRQVNDELGLELDVDHDRLMPNINTTFAQLGYGCKLYEPHRAAAAAIVRLAGKLKLGTGSVIKSKTIAASYEVLQRAGKDKAIPLSRVTVVNDIRKHTITNFLEVLYMHHKKFKPIYVEYGLSSERQKYY